MRPIDTPFGAKTPELTDAERAHLLPIFEEAQKKGRLERWEKRKADTRRRMARKVEQAKIEEEATLWLIERGIDPELFIYYNHTGRFCFYWREPANEEQYKRLLDKLGSEFPFDYDIKRHGYDEKRGVKTS